MTEGIICILIGSRSARRTRPGSRDGIGREVALLRGKKVFFLIFVNFNRSTIFLFFLPFYFLLPFSLSSALAFNLGVPFWGRSQALLSAIRGCTAHEAAGGCLCAGYYSSLQYGKYREPKVGHLVWGFLRGGAESAGAGCYEFFHYFGVLKILELLVHFVDLLFFFFSFLHRRGGVLAGYATFRRIGEMAAKNQNIKIPIFSRARSDQLEMIRSVKPTVHRPCREKEKEKN